METITRNKCKRQERYLVDTIANLHKQFQAMHPHTAISYYTFCRLRPFHELSPNIGSQETCSCKLCEIAQRILHRLKSERVVTATSIRTILRRSCCKLAVNTGDMNLKMECCFGQCETRGLTKFDGNFHDTYLNKIVNFSQWGRSKRRTMKGTQ